MSHFALDRVGMTKRGKVHTKGRIIIKGRALINPAMNPTSYFCGVFELMVSNDFVFVIEVSNI